MMISFTRKHQGIYMQLLWKRLVVQNLTIWKPVLTNSAFSKIIVIIT